MTDNAAPFSLVVFVIVIACSLSGGLLVGYLLRATRNGATEDLDEMRAELAALRGQLEKLGQDTAWLHIQIERARIIALDTGGPPKGSPEAPHGPS